MPHLESLLAVLALAAVHILCGRWRIICTEHHSRWLSFASGVAVAYVFVGLLPKMSKWQATIIAQSKVEFAVPKICEVLGIIEWCGGLKNFLNYELFLCALAGLVLFCGIDRAMHLSRKYTSGEGEPDLAPAGLFWFSIGVFAAYNTLIGYISVHSDLPGRFVLLLLVIAIGLHFLGINHGLWKNFRERFVGPGRWILAASILAGWLLGILTDFAQMVYIGMYSLLAGGIIMNVLNEELSDRHEAPFWPFFLGVTGNTLLMLSIYAVPKQ